MSNSPTWSFPGPICANIETGAGLPHNCTNPAKLTCTRCHLVKYCSAECQKKNWSLHKSDCRSPLTKSTWVPKWEKEKRESVRQSEAAKAKAPKYLFGNTEAIDVLKNTERAVDENGDLDLLFAASGDIRNVVETIVNIPESFSKNVRVLVNDLDDIVAVRSLVLLLIALNLEPTKAAEVMLHVWYSVNLPADVLDLIQKAASAIPNKDLLEESEQPTLLQMDWKSENSSQSILTTSSLLDTLRSMITTVRVPSKCNAEREKRLSSTYAVDYQETELYPADPFQRVASRRYRQHGLLVPYSAAVQGFSRPNPMIFAQNGTYYLNVASNPSHGWSATQVQTHSTTLKLPSNDHYGALHSFLLSKLQHFCTHIHNLNISFILTALDCKTLPTFLPANPTLPQRFDVIEVSNISDLGYLHFDTLTIFPSLLKLSLFPSTLVKVPTATKKTTSAFKTSFKPVIIALFQTAITDAIEFLPAKTKPLENRERLLEQAVELLDVDWADMSNEETARFRLVFMVLHMLYPVEEIWGVYRSELKWEEREKEAGVRMRVNEIVRTWPMRLERGDGERARALGMAANGTRGWDRWVEWVRG